jgi:hypothetical protein
MIGRPSPPAAPKSDHADDRPCHAEVAGQTTSLQMWSGRPQGTPRESLTQMSRAGDRRSLDASLICIWEFRSVCYWALR